MPDQTPDREILVALVDDNRISREEHERLLNLAPGVTVVSAEATLDVTMLTAEQPDVVLVEAGDTEALSLRAAVDTRRLLPEAGVIITDLVPQNEEIGNFVKAGVAGFVLKEASVSELVDTVRTVADGSPTNSPHRFSCRLPQRASSSMKKKKESRSRNARRRY